MSGFFASRKGIIAVGGVIGLLAILLERFGNPNNMGLCVVCFNRDIAGALGFHAFEKTQYMRPEVPAFVLGSLLAAMLFGEFRPRGGSSPIIRFMLGIFAAIGALVFLGCPWRALLRLAAGDLNAVTGLLGLLVGVWLGVQYLKAGYTLGRSRPMPWVGGLIMPATMVLFLGLVLLHSPILRYSEAGPGAAFAPVFVSLGFGLVIGFLAQRTRFCTMGAVRDAVLIRDFHLLSGVASLVGVAALTSLVLGLSGFGFRLQPIAHSNHLWNFLGMALSGLCFALAGGCPGRQFFLSGEGDGDAAVFGWGLIVGTAFAHDWKLAAATDRIAEMIDPQMVEMAPPGAEGLRIEYLQVGGPGGYGKIAVIIGLLFCLLLGFAAREQRKRKA